MNALIIVVLANEIIFVIKVSVFMIESRWSMPAGLVVVANAVVEPAGWTSMVRRSGQSTE